jgi:hypothetical protein
MRNRARDKKDPPDSVDWTEHPPWTPQFWMYGGPWVHPDDIPPQPWNPDWMGGGMKGIEARKKYVREIIVSAELDLERQTTRYIALHEKGMEVLDDWIKERWRQAVHTGSNKPTDPDPVSEHLAYCYRDIRYGKGRIVAGEQAFADMERSALPLLFWND